MHFEDSILLLAEHVSGRPTRKWRLEHATPQKFGDWVKFVDLKKRQIIGAHFQFVCTTSKHLIPETCPHLSSQIHRHNLHAIRCGQIHANILFE